ncbi:hypothetical protein EL22_21750 [Halostagnicola sp. A56]|uniref:hypothetical protein n=1 Tax=Halostagnicola sp. A56 TaxID=1495067 RepID=UPI00049EFBEE|nr:hypothetical protein [Halostagnicola sp. A56]KDE59478.1 hypothetical protein EL22_21750 [Halostagnicola sp. A56]
MSASARTLLATFVFGFVVTIGLVAAGTVVVEDGTPDLPDTEQDHFQPDEALPAETSDGGEITMDSQAQTNTVVIHTGGAAGGQTSLGQLPIQDTGDGPELSTGSLGGTERGVTPLVTTLIENGHEVEFYAGAATDGQLSQALSDADAFIAPGSVSFTEQDRETISTFTDAGGRFVMTANPGSSATVAELGASNGLYTEAGYLYNLTENDNNYLSIFAEPTGSSDLTDGVEEVVFRSSSAVGSSDGDAVLETEATMSTTREDGSYGVAAVDGDVAVIGDSSFLEPENAHRADNNVLVGNVADFLVTGSVDEASLPGAGNQTPAGQPSTGGQSQIPVGGAEDIPEMNNESA